MKSVYIFLITTTIFQVINEAYAMAINPTEVSAISPYPSNVKPGLGSIVDKPKVSYSSRQILPRITNANDPKNESTVLKNEVIQDPNKITADIHDEMKKTRSQLKLKSENAGVKLNQFIGRTSNSLQQILMLNTEDIMDTMTKKISSLSDESHVSSSDILRALEELRQETYNQIRQKSVDMGKAIQLSKQELVQFHQSLPEQMNTFRKNAQHQQSLEMEKLSQQYNSMLNELGTKVKQNHSQVFTLFDRIKQNFDNQIKDILKEMMEKEEALEIDISKIAAERKQNLKDAYSEAETMDEASIKEYVSQEMRSIAEEMNKIKKEMSDKMVHEITEVIDMLKAEVKSIAL